MNKSHCNLKLSDTCRNGIPKGLIKSRDEGNVILVKGGGWMERNGDARNRPCVYSQMVSDKAAGQFNDKRVDFSTNIAGTTEHPYLWIFKLF